MFLLSRRDNSTANYLKRRSTGRDMPEALTRSLLESKPIRSHTFRPRLISVVRMLFFTLWSLLSHIIPMKKTHSNIYLTRTKSCFKKLTEVPCLTPKGTLWPPDNMSYGHRTPTVFFIWSAPLWMRTWTGCAQTTAIIWVFGRNNSTSAQKKLVTYVIWHICFTLFSLEFVILSYFSYKLRRRSPAATVIISY